MRGDTVTAAGAAARGERQSGSSGARWRRWLVGSAGALLLVAAAIVLTVGWIGSERAIHRAYDREPTTPADYPFAAVTEDVRFPSRDGTSLAAWFVPTAERGRPAVLLVHGYGRSRNELLPHAAYLNRAGYNVLLIDFRGRGESGGDAITLGAHEPLDVLGAIDYLSSRTDIDTSRLAVQGVSLGASSALLALPEEPRLKVAVIESPFDTVRGVVDRSFQNFIGLPSFPFAPITIFFVERRVDADADTIRPIDAVARSGGRALFIIQDERDRLMPEDAGRRIFAAAPEPKQFWLVPNATHAQALAATGSEYEDRVLAFYRQFLEPIR